MGFNSQSGLFGVGIQSVKGTPVAATRFMRLRGGGLGGERSLLIPDPEIGGNRDIPSAYMGPITFAGDVDFYPRMQMVALLARAALGSASSSLGTAAVNEVQTVTITGTPTGGTFKLRYRGQTTATIAYNAAASAVASALTALSTVGASGFAGSGGPLPAAVTLTAGGGLVGTNIPTLEVVEPSFTGGTSPAVVIGTTTQGVPQIGTHTITPADTLPWLTIEERMGNEFESFRYVDGKVNTLHLEAEATGYLMGTAGFAALSQTSGFTEQTAPKFDETPMFVGQQVVITFGGVTFPVKSFSFDVNNNMETDDFNLGSAFAADMTEKRRQVTAGFTYRPTDATLWKQAMYGSSAVTVPGVGPAYQSTMKIEMTTVETIGAVVAGTPYRLTIDIPNAVIAPFRIAPSGDDTLQTDLEVTAIRPDSAIPIVTVTVVNDLTTVT